MTQGGSDHWRGEQRHPSEPRRAVPSSQGLDPAPRGHRAKIKVNFFLWSDQKVPPGWVVGGGGGRVSHGDKDKGADGRNCAET